MMGDTAAFTVTKENVEDDRALLQVDFYWGPNLVWGKIDNDGIQRMMCM